MDHHWLLPPIGADSSLPTAPAGAAGLLDVLCGAAVQSKFLPKPFSLLRQANPYRLSGSGGGGGDSVKASPLASASSRRRFHSDQR